MPLSRRRSSEGFADNFTEGFSEGFADGFAEDFADGFAEDFAEAFKDRTRSADSHHGHCVSLKEIYKHPNNIIKTKYKI